MYEEHICAVFIETTLDGLFQAAGGGEYHRESNTRHRKPKQREKERIIDVVFIESLKNIIALSKYALLNNEVAPGQNRNHRYQAFLPIVSIGK